MPKKIIIPATLLSVIVIIAVYAIYSFSARVDALTSSYNLLAEEKNEAIIYDKNRCLSPESVQKSLAAIDHIHSHALHPLLTSKKVMSSLNNSLTIIITQGIDCQLAAKEARLLTWPISPISAAQNSNFLSTGENLQAFINAFSTFEEMLGKRKRLLDASNDALQLNTFNTLLQLLYPEIPQTQLHDELLITVKEVNTFSINSIFANEAAEHIRLALTAIDSQIKEKLLVGPLWVTELQNATIDSKNIGRLAQWFYWVDGLPNQCQQLVEALTPLLKTASTSPIIIKNSSDGRIGFNIETHLISDCPRAAQTFTEGINNTLSDEPFLLTAQGVNTGLVSPTWLTIAESIESFVKLPFMAHSALAEKADSVFMCKSTTTDWDDQTAILMEKYTQEAIDFLTQHPSTKNTLSNNNVKEPLTIKKLTILIHALGNTAQKNLSITPSGALAVSLNELAQASERFSRFSPPFISAMKNSEALAINNSLDGLTRCVTDHARNRFLGIVDVIDKNALLVMPIMDSDVINNQETLSHFLDENTFEQWWDKQQQAITDLFNYSEPYITYLLDTNASGNTNSARTLQLWRSTQQEAQNYQAANDNNQVSTLYSLYKKTIRVEKSQCNQILQEVSKVRPSPGADIYSQRQQEHIIRLRNFCA